MQKKTIHPKGWLEKFLETQMEGLTGNIEAAGDPFDKRAWGNPEYRPEKADAGAVLATTAVDIINSYFSREDTVSIVPENQLIP